MPPIKARGPKKILYDYWPVEEARAAGLTFKENWREGRPGDLVLTDTGWVVPVLATYPKGSDKPEFMRIPTGSFCPRHWKTVLTHEASKYPATLNGKGRDITNPYRRLTSLERSFIINYMDCFSHEQSYARAHRLPMPLTAAQLGMAGMFFKRANVQREIMKNVREKLGELGMDETWVGQQLQALATCETDMVRFRAVELVTRLLEMLPKDESKQAAPPTLVIAHEEIKMLENEQERLQKNGRNLAKFSVVSPAAGTQAQDETVDRPVCADYNAACP